MAKMTPAAAWTCSAPNEPGLGGFNVVIYDNVGQFGDPAGQMTYDMFNQPLSNALAGTIDPATGKRCLPDFSEHRELDLTASRAPRDSPASLPSARSMNRTARLCLHWQARWSCATCRRASMA